MHSQLLYVKEWIVFYLYMWLSLFDSFRFISGLLLFMSTRITMFPKISLDCLSFLHILYINQTYILWIPRQDIFIYARRSIFIYIWKNHIFIKSLPQSSKIRIVSLFSPGGVEDSGWTNDKIRHAMISKQPPKRVENQTGMGLQDTYHQYWYDKLCYC